MVQAIIASREGWRISRFPSDVLVMMYRSSWVDEDVPFGHKRAMDGSIGLCRCAKASRVSGYQARRAAMVCPAPPSS